MKNTINKIIEMDKQAREIKQRAYDYSRNLAESTDAERKRILDGHTAHADEIIEKENSQRKSAADGALGEITQSSEVKRAKMQEIYDENHDKWVEQIFSRLITRD